MHYTKAYAFQLTIQWRDQIEMTLLLGLDLTRHQHPIGSMPTHTVPEPSLLNQIYTIYITKIQGKLQMVTVFPTGKQSNSGVNNI